MDPGGFGAGDGLIDRGPRDVLREGVRVLAQALMDAEVSTQIGAELYERTDARVAQRNGYRTRTWDTRVGTVELRFWLPCWLCSPCAWLPWAPAWLWAAACPDAGPCAAPAWAAP